MWHVCSECRVLQCRASGEGKSDKMPFFLSEKIKNFLSDVTLFWWRHRDWQRLGVYNAFANHFEFLAIVYTIKNDFHQLYHMLTG